MALFGQKAGVKDLYTLYEEKILKEANKRILLDDGQQEIMQVM